MELYERIEQITVTFRPAFNRELTFEWFVILLWGVLLTTQPLAVTSYLNTLSIGAEYYNHALHWFHLSGYEIDCLCRCWGRWLSAHPDTYRLNGKRVYVRDGIKVSQEGRKIPGGKRLHQESETLSKPEYTGALFQCDWRTPRHRPSSICQFHHALNSTMVWLGIWRPRR